MRVARRVLNKKSGINLDGLLSYWKLNGDGQDSYGNNHGVILYNSYFQSAKYNEGLVCGSNTMGMEVSGDNFSFTDGSNDLPFSVNFWVKKNDNGNYWFVNKRKSNASNVEYQIVSYAGKTVFGIYGGGTSVNYINAKHSSLLPVGQWVMITAVYTGDGYENGLLVYISGEDSTNERNAKDYDRMIATPSKLTFGNPEWHGGFNLNGALDDLSVWNIALSPEKVAEIYNLQKELL